MSRRGSPVCQKALGSRIILWRLALVLSATHLALPWGAGAQDVIHVAPRGVIHHIVVVPAGEFTMGTDEKPAVVSPAHVVYLDSFLIDKYEVSVAQFLVFLNDMGRAESAAGDRWVLMADLALIPPYIDVGGRFVPTYPDSTDHPVASVTWFGAVAYCEWAGLRLPTEAEWEKAARGTDGRRYASGESCDRTTANYGIANPSDRPDASDGYYETAPVGSFSAGVSPYGVYNMTANVSEWVSDWNRSDYYSVSDYRNPQGPSWGMGKVVRGGSYLGACLPVWYRSSDHPRTAAPYIGFRCAGDVVETATHVGSASWGGVKRATKKGK